jgi:hypothetical protein
LDLQRKLTDIKPPLLISVAMSSSNDSPYISSPDHSSTISSSATNDLRSWLCPFADTSAYADDEHDPYTHVKSGFIATASEEARHVPVIRQGFTSYQAALDGHKPFSKGFLDSERTSTAKAIEQLQLLSSVFQELTAKAWELPDDVVPAEMRAELHLARVWVAKHRASLVSCHVFLKINYSLASDKPNDGTVEPANYAVQKHRHRTPSICPQQAAAKGHRRAASSVVPGQSAVAKHQRRASLIEPAYGTKVY